VASRCYHSVSGGLTDALTRLQDAR